jgi:hypothetical protein
MQTLAEVEQALKEAHAERGRALATGVKFDNGRIVRLHERMAELEDVAAAQAEMARKESAKQHAAQVTAINREIEDLMSASAKALSESRAAYHQAAALMRTHLETESSLRKAATRAKQLGVTVAVENPFELERKRSLQIASVGLKPINNHPSRFGNLTWPMALIAWKD